jgi:nicotinamidase-related amidase
MRQALIIVDMQSGSFTPATPRYDAEGLVARLNDLASRVRGAGGLVIFVQHVGPENDPHHPTKPGFQMLPELQIESGDRRVLKTACDAFLSTSLAEELAAGGIRDLIVTGCATEYCLDTTVRSALGRGYRVVVPRDGHTTADRPHLSATKIIEHHNAIWSDFISPVGPARVCACDEAVSAPATPVAAI